MRRTLEAALDEFAIVGLVVDCDMEGVDVPSTLKGIQMFELGRNLPRPMKEFSYYDEGVYVGLSFGGFEYYCTFPYRTVKALRFTGMYENPPKKVSKPPKKPSHLRVVK
jgi:hypothetical protein